MSANELEQRIKKEEQKIWLRLDLIENLFLPLQYRQNIDSGNIFEMTQQVIQNQELCNEIRYDEWTKLAEEKLGMDPNIAKWYLNILFLYCITDSLFKIFEAVHLDNASFLKICRDKKKKLNRKKQGIELNLLILLMNSFLEGYFTQRIVKPQKFFLFLWLQYKIAEIEEGCPFEAKPRHDLSEEIYDLRHRQDVYQSLNFINSSLQDMMLLISSHNAKKLISGNELNHLSVIIACKDNSNLSSMFQFWSDENLEKLVPIHDVAVS